MKNYAKELRSMVIWFNVKKARDFLLKNGYVYTLRPKKEKGRNRSFKL
jgi:hypothetical protein